jgi:hypothetical protein
LSTCCSEPREIQNGQSASLCTRCPDNDGHDFTRTELADEDRRFTNRRRCAITRSSPVTMDRNSGPTKGDHSTLGTMTRFPGISPVTASSTAPGTSPSRSSLHFHPRVIGHLLHIHLSAHAGRAGRPLRAYALNIERDRHLARLFKLKRDW